MITVNVKQLVEAIREADAFTLPNMNAGTEYIYNDIYTRLSQNMEVRLSEINFGRFELDDIDTIREMHSNLESYAYKAETLTRSLQGLSPVVAAAAFI